MQLFGFSYIFRNGTQTKNLYSAMWPFYFLPKPNYMFHIINPKPNMITATKDIRFWDQNTQNWKYRKRRREIVAGGAHVHFECGVGGDGQQQIMVDDLVLLIDASLCLWVSDLTKKCSLILYIQYITYCGYIVYIYNKSTYMRQKFSNSSKNPSIGCTWLPLIHTTQLS